MCFCTPSTFRSNPVGWWSAQAQSCPQAQMSSISFCKWPGKWTTKDSKAGHRGWTWQEKKLSSLTSVLFWCGAEDWTQGLACDKHMLCHWAPPSGPHLWLLRWFCHCWHKYLLINSTELLDIYSKVHRSSHKQNIHRSIWLLCLWDPSKVFHFIMCIYCNLLDDTILSSANEFFPVWSNYNEATIIIPLFNLLY